MSDENIPNEEDMFLLNKTEVSQGKGIIPLQLN